MWYRRTGRLMIWAKRDFPLVMEASQQDEWCLTFKTNVFGRKTNTQLLKEMLLLDIDTSNKVRDIQDEANTRIINLVKANYNKASVITEENLKGAWGPDE